MARVGAERMKWGRKQEREGIRWRRDFDKGRKTRKGEGRRS